MDEYKKPSNDECHKMVCHTATEGQLCYVKYVAEYHIITFLLIWQSIFREIFTMWIFCKEYTNRWGKRMIASEYGHTAWRFWVPVRRKKR